jgi:hypothetical protein
MAYYVKGTISSGSPQILCGGPGDNCLVGPVAEDAAISDFHDASLAELTVRYNELMGPYLQEREDGRVLRTFIAPDGRAVFVWALCYGEDADSSDIEEKHGPMLTDPVEITKALGLSPT